MVLKLRLSATAREDLVDAWTYASEDGVATADALLDRVFEVAAKLAEMPGMGRERPELLEELRSFPAGMYVLYYRVRGGHLEVVRVLHGRRDIEAAF